jgi:hypothetical protein
MVGSPRRPIGELLAHPERDMRELVTDGEVLVWIEGREPGPAPADSPIPSSTESTQS